jgi:hypothetical protein
MENKKATMGIVAWIYFVSMGMKVTTKTNDSEGAIRIEDLIIDNHNGKPVSLADVQIFLEEASNGLPFEEACDIVVKIEGEEVERFENRVPPYVIAPVE